MVLTKVCRNAQEKTENRALASSGQQKALQTDASSSQKIPDLHRRKSEAIYFAHYKSSTGPVVIALDKSDHKLSLVNKAIEERNSRIQTGEFDEELDEVWVVLDRDADPSNKLDKAHFNQALNLAEKNDVFIAYSNDAFELWIILHYQDLWASTHRDQLFKMLSKHRGKKYEKGEDLYGEIKPFRPKAIQRATKLLKSKHRPERDNPSTTVHKLVAKTHQ